MKLGTVYWLFAIIYAFMKYGFWIGMGNIIIPIAPLIDFVKFLLTLN